MAPRRTATSRSWPRPTPASATWSATSTRSRWPRAAPSGDPETVHYGLLPRTNRGIFGINELPDLAERIQVAMFNVLEERDIQVRGYSLRLPIDLLLVASANPEDYTNRGRIITPLKDRFGAEIRTHYPERGRRGGRAHRPGGRAWSPTVPRAPARGRRPADPRAARVAVGRPALRRQRPLRDRRRRGCGGLRAAARGPGRRRAPRSPACATCPPCCRRCSARSSSRWVRRAARPRWSGTCCAWPSPRPSASGWRDSTSPASSSCSPRATTVETGELVPAARAARPGRHGAGSLQGPRPARATATTRRPGQVAAAVELVLEGLHLTRRIDKD